MLIIRSLLYIIGANIILILVSTTSIVFSLLPIKYRYYIISRWAIFCVWWLKITCDINIVFQGVNNIPNKPCVIVMNHQSTLDTLFLQKIMPPHTWVVKKQLLFIPFFGWGMATLKPIIINRETKIKALKKIINQGVLRIKQNLFVLIYPEGTRQQHNKVGNYQIGGLMMARKAKTAVLPIAHNAGKVWSKGSIIKKPGTIYVKIGKLIDYNEQQNPKKLAQDIELWTKEQLKTWQLY